MTQEGKERQVEEGAEFQTGEISNAPMDTSPVWLNRGSVLAKYIGRPIHRYFTEVQAAGGIVLIVATVVAIVWANTFRGSYDSFWHTEIDISIAGVEIFQNSLGHFVNDVLMVLFFLVAGLEIKKEMVAGSLRKFKDGSLPVIAAVGGMLVPALIFVLFNLGTDDLKGWAIPTATDIAFAIGIISLLGNRIPSTFRVFLLTLCVVDDLLAILVIALFYSGGIEFPWLLGAVALVIVHWICRRARVWYTPLYFALGILLWWMTYRSGVHPTVAGVAIGFLIPVKPLQERHESQAIAYWLQEKAHVYVSDVRWANFQLSESVSVGDRVIAHLHPITSFFIIPIFALANAGIDLSGGVFSSALINRVTLGVIVGLLGGKLLGITLFTFIATKLKISELPAKMNWGAVSGLSILAGIGFTVAIFVSTLAFGDDGTGNSLTSSLGQAKFGIFLASFVAALLGTLILHFVYNKKGSLNA